MNMRTTNDPYGGNDPLVDKMIGNAYPIVRCVAMHIDVIKHVSHHLEEIYNVSVKLPEIQLIVDNLPMLQAIYDELDNLVDISAELALKVNISQLGAKEPCAIATEVDVPITRSGFPVVNGYQTVVNDRVLDLSDPDKTLRGIYVASAGVWQRAYDWNADEDVSSGQLIPIEDAQLFQVSFPGSFDLGVTEPNFTSVKTTSDLEEINTQSFVATEGQTVFNLTLFEYLPHTGSMWVFINGVKQNKGVLEPSSTQVVLDTPRTAGDDIEIMAFNVTTLGVPAPTMAANVGTIAGSNVEVELAARPLTADVQGQLNLKPQEVANVAAARALTGVPNYAAILLMSANGGTFLRDPTDVTSADNFNTLGTIIRPADYATNGVYVLQPTGQVRQAVAASSIPANGPSYRMGYLYASIDPTLSGSWAFDGRVGFPNKLGINNTKPVTEPATGPRVADATYVAGTAQVAGIIAGYDNVNNALAGMIASQHSMLYTGADHASIFGGSLHTIKDDTDYSTILGGTSCTIKEGGRYAAIISSDQCKIETGASDDLSGFRSLISNSALCTASGRNALILTSLSSAIHSKYGTIIGGETVTITNGDHALAGGNTVAVGATAASAYSVAWGLSITVDGGRCLAVGEGHVIGAGHDYSSAVGLKAITPFTGSHVRGSRHRGGIAGRNQHINFSCSQETTDTTLTSLSLAGASSYPIQPEDSVVNGFVLVTGVNTANGACSTFRIDFTSERVGSGTPTLRANTTTTVYNGLTIVTVPTMNATTGGIYRVRVVGIAATNIAWDASFCIQQVVFTP